MLLNAIALLLTVLYPLAIWLAHGQVEPRWLALLLLLAVACRLPALKLQRAARWSVAAGLLLAACALWSNLLLPLKLYPVLVNAVLLLTFGYSLWTPQSVVERLARLRETDFPPAAVQYTRRVTQVWCGFFIVNGSIALGTALWASEAVWSLYTGLIAYILMGLLFGAEYLVRLRFKRLHHA
ncbi:MULTISPECIES: hypothetical protein [unclassified Janthinobacterium]|uniref:COG4648 family protein n=1 Tax=unclassified Janthinobacterium TaxID=2610881 RepID=UPI001622D0A2|nr:MULTISPECIES: hypothetical protein [unclassified Janthinobacterium]MBB5607759.1 putative membrane protein [Janthinobacterium sp. S3T4]MBB5613092.1 putative membrane protein [Janthinobacterium sp. S3M3]